MLRKEAFEDIFPSETFNPNFLVSNKTQNKGGERGEEELQTTFITDTQQVDEAKNKFGGSSAKEEGEEDEEEDEDHWSDLVDREEKKLLRHLRKLKQENVQLSRKRQLEMKTLEKTKVEVEKQNREAKEVWKNLYYEEKAKTEPLQMQMGNLEKQLHSWEEDMLGAVREKISTNKSKVEAGRSKIGGLKVGGKWPLKNGKGFVEIRDLKGVSLKNGGSFAMGKNKWISEARTSTCVGLDPLSNNISENKTKELQKNIRHLKERIMVKFVVAYKQHFNVFCRNVNIK